MAGPKTATAQLSDGIIYAVRRVIKVGIYAAGAAFLYFSVIGFGPEIELRWFPVISDFKILQRGLTNEGDLWLIGRFYKKRDCRFLGLGFLSKLGDDGDWQILSARVIGVEPGQLPEPRPEGWNITRVWEVARPLEPSRDATQLWGVLVYDCGLPWLTLQKVGPFAYWGLDPSPPSLPYLPKL